MNRAKAADVAKAIVNQGIPCSVNPGPDDTQGWTVAARLTLLDNIDVATVHTFVTNQGVIGTVTGVIFS